MTAETEDQLRQYFRDATATVDGRPELVRDAVHAGRARLRRRSRATVGAAVAASLGIALMVPIIRSATDPAQHDSSPAATAPITALPRIATSSWRPGDDVSPLFTLLRGAPLSLSSDGQCLVLGNPEKNPDVGLAVWPAGYSVILRDGDVAVLDETGAEAARVGDRITAVGGFGDSPANACGLSFGFNIQGGVSSTRP
jgi:hypothetical protein